MSRAGNAFTAAVMFVAVINAVGGIVAGIWFAVNGDWSAIGWGIAWLIAGPFVASLAIMPGMIFGIPGMRAAERGDDGTARLMAVLSGLYTNAVMVFLSLVVTGFFFRKVHSSPLLPTLLWAYTASVLPWVFLAEKDQQSGGNEFSSIATLFLQFGYVIGGILVLFSPDNPQRLLWSLLLAMLACAMLQQQALGESLARERNRF